MGQGMRGSAEATETGAVHEPGRLVGQGSLPLWFPPGYIQQRAVSAAFEVGLGAKDAVGEVDAFANGALALVVPRLFQTDTAQGGVKGRDEHGRGTPSED